MVGRALVPMLCAALGGCAGAGAPRPESAAPPALVPGPVLLGAALAPPLRSPLAVAARGGELYVLDAAAGVVRVDPHASRVTPILRRAFSPGAKLALDADGSFYVLEPASRRLQRFARDGRLLSSYGVDATVGSLTGFALDPERGRIVALDSLHRQLVVFRPVGTFVNVPLRAEPRHAISAVSAIALGAGAIYAADPRCACLARITPEGQVLGTFGHAAVRQPGQLAVDRYGRVLVFDHGDRRLKLFRGEQLAAQIDLLRLGVTEVSDFTLAEDWLYIVDAPGGQLRLFRLLPP